LIGLLILQLVLPEAPLPDATETPPSPAAPVAAPSAYRSPARESFDALVERPPFARDRRPERVAATSPEDAVAAPPDIRLLGIISSAETWIAVIKLPSAEGVMNVRSGDMVEGWRVTHIDRGRVVLEAGDKKVEMWLDGEERRGSNGVGLLFEGSMQRDDGQTE
jgi:Tfp pilus assembly protein PilP